MKDFNRPPRAVRTRGILAIALLSLAACASPPLERAFEPKTGAAESNKTIGDYCLTCHVHRDFSPLEHVEKVRQRYKDPVHSQATECRACHSLEKTWLLDMKRKTHWPPPGE